MMVNQLNNNSAQWQSTIPNQMPWLNSPSNAPMQFGQSSYEPDIALPTTASLLTPPPASTQLANTIAPIHTTAPKPGLTFINPFDPQQLAATQLLNDGTPTTSQQYNTSQPIISSTSSSCSTQSTSGHFESSFLTQLPSQQPSTMAASAACFETQPMHHKRSSIEMEDELTASEAPPTKQQLSESRLFKRFGSLHLDGETPAGAKENDDEIDSDDSEDGRLLDGTQSRKEFNRYVYLLFKDKKSNNLFDDSTSRAMERLIRDERDKLNKAVILWNPPMRNFFVSEAPDSDDDDDEIRYTDHKDFLKNSGDNDSIIITEIEDDAEIEDLDTGAAAAAAAAPTAADDDVMLD